MLCNFRHTKLSLFYSGCVCRLNLIMISLFSLKLPLFPINKFPTKIFKGIRHTYIMINAFNEGICVEFWRKNNTTLVYLLSNCRQVLKLFKTNPLNIIFDDFSIWLLWYRTEFSCLYLPQWHNKYCVATKYRWICKKWFFLSAMQT